MTRISFLHPNLQFVILSVDLYISQTSDRQLQHYNCVINPLQKFYFPSIEKKKSNQHFANSSTILRQVASISIFLMRRCERKMFVVAEVGRAFTPFNPVEKQGWKSGSFAGTPKTRTSPL